MVPPGAEQRGQAQLEFITQAVHHLFGALGAAHVGRLGQLVQPVQQQAQPHALPTRRVPALQQVVQVVKGRVQAPGPGAHPGHRVFLVGGQAGQRQVQG